MRTIHFCTALLLFLAFIMGCDISNPFSSKQNDSYPASIETMKLPKQLTSTGRDFMAYWSPDGEHIAFLTVRNTYDPLVEAILFELWLMDENGHDQHPLIKFNDTIENSINLSSVCWYSDAHHLLVNLFGSHSSEIWQVGIDGEKIRLTDPQNYAQYPTISPDGSKIAYLVQGPNPPLGSPVYRLYVANDDGTNPMLIETGLIEKYCWTADGQGVIYPLYDFEKANFDLWQASLTGNEKKKITNTLESETEPTCSSDGKYLAFCMNDALYVTPIHDFQPSKLVSNARSPRWLPNKNLILIYAEQTTDSTSFWTQSWLTDLQGNIVKRFSVGDFSEVNFSPDGRYIIYSSKGNLWVDRLF